MSDIYLQGSWTGAGQKTAALDWLQARIARAPWGAFAILTVWYVAVAAALSSFKLLWLDELITLHIAQQGSVAAIWHALAMGADPNPPVSHLLVHYSRLLFGDHEFAYRLPAIVGYWVGLVSLFAYLLRRVPAVWALAGTVLSMTMAAFDYSFESRSYAIFYGLAMLAMFCWTLAVDSTCSRRVRGVAWAGMILALAAGISTNYFAVLAFFPIAGGEIARTLDRLYPRALDGGPRLRLAKAIDFRIWMGLALAGSTLLAYRSLIAHAIAQFSPYAWNKVSIGQVFDSYTEMVEVVLSPILALFAFALILLLLSRQLSMVREYCRDRLDGRWIAHALFGDSWRFPVPLHEAAAIFLLMAYPFLGYIVASIRGGMLSPRFVIPVCFGFAIGGTFVAFGLFRHLRFAGAVMLLFCLAWFIARELVVGYWYMEQKDAFDNVVDQIPRAEGDVSSRAPIVIPDPLLAITFEHYAPRSLAARVVFPVDFPAIRTFRHDDSPEENLWAGRSLYSRPRIVPLATFQHTACSYLIIAKEDNWLLQDLSAHGYPVRRLPLDPRAEAIGGFTPLAHGTPFFFTAVGDRGAANSGLPRQPFNVSDNLPDSKAIVPGEVAQ
jgi:hypothetical protein